MRSSALLVFLSALIPMCEEEEGPPPVPPAQHATVTVVAHSTPPGAHVTGGGRALGTTPLTTTVPVPLAQPGQVQTFPFTFAAPGYEPLTLDASPVNNTISLSATLVPVGGAIAGTTTPTPGSGTTAPPEPEPSPAPSGELGDAEARRLITRYYNGRGEWAGEYVIDSIERMRMERQGADAVEVHTRYRYRCVQGHCSGTAQVGTDQRVFSFRRNDGSWRVVRMSGHMTARM